MQSYIDNQVRCDEETVVYEKISLIILAFIILGCNPKHSNKTENKNLYLLLV